MECEACGIENKQGDTYIVRYGNKTAESMRGKVITKVYGIEGVEKVFICDTCLDKWLDRKALSWYIGGMLMAVIMTIIVTVGDPSASAGKNLLILLFVGSLFTWAYFGVRKEWKGPKQRSRWGDNYAIWLMKPELKEKGYNNFFTRED